MTVDTESQQGLRVLLAEDEALIRLDLAEMLTDAGYEVVGQASNGEEAVSLADSLQPDLIIMDVKMPVMDGLTAAETIGEKRICPVIMLTAFSQKELVERARDAGVMAYIVKPFTVSDVTPAIEVATSRAVEPAGYWRTAPSGNLRSIMCQSLTGGTGSYPDPPKGWHLQSLRKVSHPPFTGPCWIRASRP